MKSFSNTISSCAWSFHVTRPSHTPRISVEVYCQQLHKENGVKVLYPVTCQVSLNVNHRGRLRALSRLR